MLPISVSVKHSILSSKYLGTVQVTLSESVSPEQISECVNVFFEDTDQNEYFSNSLIKLNKFYSKWKVC